MLVQENDEEWYLWIDVDTVIIDVQFKLPFDRFEGKDFVTWGNSTRIRAGDAMNGTNICTHFRYTRHVADLLRIDSSDRRHEFWSHALPQVRMVARVPGGGCSPGPDT